MDIEELATLYREATQVQNAAVRASLSESVARLAATQSVMDAQPDVTPQGLRASGTSKALTAKARKEIVAAAAAIAKALKNPTDIEAAEAIAAEAIAAEAIAAEPLAAEPFAAEPLAAEPFAAEPLAAEPFAAEPLTAEPLASEPFVAEPLAAEPFSATNAPNFTAALQAFIASAGDTTGGGSKK